MATTQIKTRILNKIDSYQSWLSESAIVLLKGEIGIATIETSDSASGLTPPATGLKIGDGKTTFANLPWIQAIAGDVSTFVKTKLTTETAFNELIATQVAGNSHVTTLETAVQNLTDKVSGLETAIGNEESGLTKRVTDLETLTGGHTTTINNLSSNKVDKTVAEDATSTDKLVKASTVDSKIETAINASETELNKAIGNAAQAAASAQTDATQALTNAAAAQTAADNAQADATENAGKISTIEGDISTINTNISELQEAVGLGESVGGQTLTDRVGSLEGIVGDAEEGLVKDVADNTAAIGNLNTAVNGEGGIDDRLEVVEGKVTTLVGEDTNKSVRTIANEELAKQLIPEGAAESLNTLQEIAQWIQDHPDDASAMNEQIEQNKTDIATNAGDISDLKTANTNLGQSIETVKTDIMGTATYGTDTIGSVKAAAAAAQSKADTAEANAQTGITNAATAQAAAEAAQTSADEAKTAAGTALTDAKAYTDQEIGTLSGNITTKIEAMDYSLTDGEGLLSTLTQTDGVITAHTRRKVAMADMSDTDTFVFYCGTASEVQ